MKFPGCLPLGAYFNFVKKALFGLVHWSRTTVSHLSLGQRSYFNVAFLGNSRFIYWFLALFELEAIFEAGGAAHHKVIIGVKQIFLALLLHWIDSLVLFLVPRYEILKGFLKLRISIDREMNMITIGNRFKARGFQCFCWMLDIN